MNMNLGEKLKILRKGHDLTQEQLAERLGISSQAVSKWETNSSYPDISILPVLANFYGVTTDELLGVDISKNKEKIEAYTNEMFDLYRDWKLKEMVDVARKACAEFPGDDELLYNLAWALGEAQNVIRTKTENLDEAILIAERILADSRDTGLRLRATSLLSYLYHWKGNDDKALDYAYELPALTQTSSYVIGRLGLKKGEENIKYARSLIESYFRAIVENIKILCDFDTPSEKTNISTEMRVEMLRDMMRIQESVFGKDLLFENFSAMQICYTIASLYLIIDKTNEALDYLKKAFEYACKYEDYDEKSQYSSALMFGEKPYEKNMYSQGAYQDLLSELTDENSSKKYGVLKNSYQYKTIINQLEKRVRNNNSGS